MLDVCQLAVGPWGASLLGQLGADVIKIEDPRGDPIRNLLPEMGGVGTYYTAVNQNKRNIALNLKDPDHLAVALALAERADVFVENFRPGVMERLGLGYEALRALNPQIVYCSSSGFGNRGPRRMEGSADGYARSFTAFDASNGPVGRPGERFRAKGHIDHTCSAFVTQTVLAGLIARERFGIGQKVETSMMQATMVYQTSRIAEFFADGKSPPALGSATTNLVPHQAFLAADGYVAIGVNTEHQWRALCNAIGQPALADDERFRSNRARVQHRLTLLPVLEAALRSRTVAAWVDALSAAGVPCSPFLTFNDLWAHEQVQANRLIVATPHSWGEHKVGGTPWQFSGTPVEISRAPAMDEHRDEIIAMVSSTPPRREVLAPERALPVSGPLDGLRVVELAQGIAGPMAGMQLGDLGAEVTKVEPPGGDWSRGLGPPFVHGESPVFLALNRNKRGAVLDIESAEPRAALLALLAQADVFISDLLPAEAVRLGLDASTLRRAFPRLVHASLTPFGEQGPMRDRAGGEIVLQAMGDIWRYLGALDQPPERLAADASAGACAVFAVQGVLAALCHREQSGEGQTVQVSELGSLMAIETQLHAAQSNDTLRGGWHLSAPTDPPQYDLQSSDLGIDFGFMARNADGFGRFCEALGVPEHIASDTRFNSGLGQTLNWDAFVEAFEPYTRPHTAAALKQMIEDAGGVCVVCNTYETLIHDPQVAALDMIQTIGHPTAGQVKMLGLPWNLERTPGSIRCAAPLLGQHTAEVLGKE